MAPAEGLFSFNRVLQVRRVLLVSFSGMPQRPHLHAAVPPLQVAGRLLQLSNARLCRSLCRAIGQPSAQPSGGVAALI